MASKKKSSKPAAPTPRNFADEMQQISQAAQASAQAQADQAIRTNQAYIDQSLKATRDIGNMLDNGYTQNARDQINGALGQINPMLNDAGQVEGLGGVLANLGNSAAQNAVPTEIEKMLQSQALQDLSLGGTLSAEDQRNARQGALSAFASRGTAVGTPAALSEVLNRQAFSDQRLANRRSFADSVNTSLLNNQNARLGMAGNLLGQAGNTYAQGAGMRQNAAGLGLQGAASLINIDPLQRALGSNIPIASQGASSNLTSNAYNGILGYGQDLYNTNLNMQASLYNTYQNNQAALKAAQIGAQGAAAGARSASTGGMLGSSIGALGSIGGGVASGMATSSALSSAMVAAGGTAAF